MGIVNYFNEIYTSKLTINVNLNLLIAELSVLID